MYIPKENHAVYFLFSPTDGRLKSRLGALAKLIELNTPQICLNIININPNKHYFA